MSAPDAAPETATDERPLTIAPVEPAREPALLALYERLLADGARTAALYAWRRDHADASGGVVPFIALHGEDPVGAVSAWPVEIAWRGERMAAAWQGDSIVDPELRGRGLAKRLVNALGERWAVTLAKGTSPAMYALRRKVGFRDVPNRDYLALLAGPLSGEGSWKRRLATPFLWAAQTLRRRGGARRPSAALRIAPVARFGPEYDALAERVAAGDEVAPVKTSAYLNWRYAQCPVRRYTILEGRDGGGALRGAAVVRAGAAPRGDAWIVDLVCDTGDEEAGRALLDAALAELRGRRAGWVRTFATSPRARRWLLDLGFRDTGHTPQFTWRARPGGDAAALERADWNFWHGDGDVELY